MPPSAASAPRIEPVQLMLAHELVLEQLRTALALGRFRAGDTLPRERDLAEMLQCLRPPVREALAVLASEGVIEIRRGRGGGLFVTGRPPTRRQRSSCCARTASGSARRSSTASSSSRPPRGTPRTGAPGPTWPNCAAWSRRCSG